MAAEARIKFPPPAPVSPADPAPEVFAHLKNCPVAQGELPGGGTAWLVGGYEQVRQVLTDQRFSRALAAAPDRSLQGIELSAAESIIAMDPPEHTRLRKLVAGAFTVRRVETLRPRVAAIVDELINAFTARPQPADLMTSFSMPLPVRVICELLGVPTADMDKFRTWSATLIGDWEQDSGEILTALAELYQYFAELIRINRARPGDDLLSALIAARDFGDGLSEEELTNLACTILVAGYETTAHHISLSLLALLDNPAEMARLRADPALIPGAVEELLRYVRIGVLPMARVTTEDVKLGGATIPAGEVVLPIIQAANRDRRCSASRTDSTSAAHQLAIWDSAAARTTASAPSWPGWNFMRPCPGWSPGCRAWRWPSHPPTSSSSLGWPYTTCARCPSPGPRRSLGRWPESARADRRHPPPSPSRLTQPLPAAQIGPRTLRHAFITAALDAAVPLRDVQEAASNAYPRTTTRYDQARTSLDRHAHTSWPPTSPGQPGKDDRGRASAWPKSAKQIGCSQPLPSQRLRTACTLGCVEPMACCAPCKECSAPPRLPE